MIVYSTLILTHVVCGLEYDVIITSSGQRASANLAVCQAARGMWDLPGAGTSKGTYSVKVADSFLADGSPVSVTPTVVHCMRQTARMGYPKGIIVAQGTAYRANKKTIILVPSVGL